MKVPGWPRYDYLFTQHSAQHCRDCRRLCIEQACVANQRNIAGQLFRVAFHERHQRRRPGFLFTFEHESQVARQCPVNRFPGTARLDKSHKLPLVVACSARADDLARRSFLQFRFKRIGFPQVQRVNRLNIVMPVEKQVLAVAFGLSDHHRVALGWSHFCFGAQ